MGLAEGYYGWQISNCYTDPDGVIAFATGDHVGDPDWIFSNTSANDVNWHQAVGVFNGTYKFLYLDGKQVASPVNQNVTDAAVNLIFGARYSFL